MGKQTIVFVCEETWARMMETEIRKVPRGHAISLCFVVTYYILCILSNLLYIIVMGSSGTGVCKDLIYSFKMITSSYGERMVELKQGDQLRSCIDNLGKRRLYQTEVMKLSDGLYVWYEEMGGFYKWIFFQLGLGQMGRV